MVIAKAEDAEKIRAGDDDAPAEAGDADQLTEERLRLIDMLKDVERTSAVEMLAGDRNRFPSVLRACW